MRYECEWCGRRFKTSRALKAHCTHPNVRHYETAEEFELALLRDREAGKET